MLTDEQLDEIEERARQIPTDPHPFVGPPWVTAFVDVPALVAEVRRLRAAFKGVVDGKVLGDPWSITSALAKERDALQSEVNRLQQVVLRSDFTERR